MARRPGGAAAASLAPDAPPRPQATLAAEDVLLALWVLFGGGLAAALPGFRVDAGWGPGTAGAVAAVFFIAPLPALVAVAQGLGPGGWIIAASMLFAFGTRGVEDVDLDTAVLRRLFFAGAFYWLLGPLAMLVNAIAWGLGRRRARRRGADPDAVVMHKGWPGYPLSSRIRRLGALPAMLGGELAFRSALGTAGAAWTPGDASWAAAVLAISETVPAFLLFVVSPRLATGGVLAVLPWVLRYLVYLAAVWAGGHWLEGVVG